MPNLPARTLLLAMLVAAGPAAARNLSLPDGKPALSFVLPDAWKPSDTAAGWESTSDDGDVYVSVEYARNYKDDLRQVMEANGKWMAENKIKPDAAPTHDRDFTLNGMAAHEIIYDAHDKDGPTNVIFTLVELPRDAIGVVTVWASAKQREAHLKALAGVFGSIKAID